MSQSPVSPRSGKPGGRSAVEARHGVRSRSRVGRGETEAEAEAEAGAGGDVEVAPGARVADGGVTGEVESVEIVLEIDRKLLEQGDVARELSLRYLEEYLVESGAPTMSRGELGEVLEVSGWRPALKGKPASEQAIRDFVRDELGRGAREVRYRGDGASQAFQRYHRTLEQRGQAMSRASARLAEQSYADDAVASFYIAQANAPANLLNGVTGLLSTPLRKAGLPGIPEIPRFDLVGEYGEKQGKTLETGAVLGLGLVVGASGVVGELGSALRGVEVGGVGVGRGAVTAGEAYAAGSAGSQLHEGASGLAEDLLVLEFGTVTEGENTREATEEERRAAHDRVVERLGDAALGVVGAGGYRAMGGKPASGRSGLPVARARAGRTGTERTGRETERARDGDERDSDGAGKAPRSASLYRERDADGRAIDPKTGLSDARAAQHRERIDEADRRYRRSGEPEDLERALAARHERYRERMGNRNPPVTPWDRARWEARNPQLRPGVMRAREVEPEALRAAGVERHNDAAGQYRQYSAVDVETGRTTTTRPDGFVGPDVVETKYVSPEAKGQTVYKTRQLDAQQKMARAQGGAHRVIVSSEDGARLAQAPSAPRPSSPLAKDSQIEFYDAGRGRITHVWDKDDGRWVPVEEKQR